MNEPDRVLLTSPTERLSGFFRRRHRRRRRSSTRRSIFTFESSTLKKAKGPQVHCRRKDPKSCPVCAAKTLFFFVETGFLFVRIWTFGALEQAEGAEENFARASRPKS